MGFASTFLSAGNAATGCTDLRNREGKVRAGATSIIAGCATVNRGGSDLVFRRSEAGSDRRRRDSKKRTYCMVERRGTCSSQRTCIESKNAQFLPPGWGVFAGCTY